MIPAYPNVRAISLADRPILSVFTERFAPYSDFVHTALWSWDLAGEVRVSELNGNLVVLFHNPGTRRYFYSFIGDHAVNETAAVLLESSTRAGYPTELRLVPEEAARALDASRFLVKEDRDHFDYILECDGIASYQGRRYDYKRHWVNNFTRLNGCEIGRLDLHTGDASAQIIALCAVWRENKLMAGKEIGTGALWGGGGGGGGDLSLTDRLLPHAAALDLLGVGVWAADRLIACSFSELLPGDYAMTHFVKADVRHRGVYEVLMQETARIFLEHGRHLMNYQEDLGIGSLRQSKLSYRPISFLKKYSVRCIG